MSVPFADAIFWIAAACCAIAQIAIVRSAIVSPARAAASQPSPSLAQRTGEIAWAVLPGIVLALVMLWTWRTMHGAPHFASTITYDASK